MNELNLGLSEHELDELDNFLAQDSLQGRAMDVSMLEGFAAAMIVGPQMVPPSRWLCWVWDADAGVESPEFESKDHANRIMGLVLRHYNAVARAFMDDPGSFEPLFHRGERWSVADWCAGFLLGQQFCDEQWNALMKEQLAWFTPFVMLGSDADDGAAGEETESYVQRWTDAVAPTLVKMHAHWRAAREQRPAGLIGDRFPLGRQQEPVRRSTPKAGRNDPCPCGSGKKFKKCCGAATVH